jgi:hypothetical protein
MTFRFRNMTPFIMSLAVLWLVLPGRTQTNTDFSTFVQAKDKEKDKDDHPDFGPHGGPLAEWGDEVYHAESTVDTKNKQAVIYILDDKAKNAPKIDPNKITDMKLTILEPKLALELKHDPKRTDAKGIAFVSEPNDAFVTSDFAGNIRGKAAGTPYSADFKKKKK